MTSEPTDTPRGNANTRIEAASALRELLHAFAAGDPDEATLETLTDLIQNAVTMLDDHPRRTRTIPDFATLESLRAAGIDLTNHALADRAVAGPANPAGVHIEARRAGDEAIADVVFGPAFEGAPGRVHGGMVAAVFDDITGYALAMVQEPGFTGRLTINYHAPVPVETTIEFRARYRERQGRKLYVDADARIHNDVLATAEALFILVDRERFLADATDD